MITILLVDDHQMLRDGLRSVLEKQTHMTVVGEADNGRTAVELAEQLVPDVVIMDIGMPHLNGIDATRQLTAGRSQVKVIALSMHSDKRYALKMLEAGARGYVLKGAAIGELVRAIETVSAGKNYLSPEIAGIVVESYVDRDYPSDGSVASVLGRREREVLQLLAEGKTSKQIAASLHISVKTAETHRRNLMKKLDIHTIADLTKFAVREGLTPLES